MDFLYLFPQVVTSSEMKEAKIAAAQKEERLQKELQERKTLMTHSLKQPKCGPNLFSVSENLIFFYIKFIRLR